MKPSVMYKAFKEKNASCNGLFYAAITTTKIFCNPSCTARKAKREHITFFKTASEALQSGYRPCKKCRPLGTAAELVPQASKALALLEANPESAFTDTVLLKHGLKPHLVRREFIKRYGITFQQYRRSLRIADAKSRLDKGESVSGAAFSSGYQSLSGFQHTFKRLMRVSPSSPKRVTILQTIQISTPIGEMLAGASDKGVCILSFITPDTSKRHVDYWEKRLQAKLLPGRNQHLSRLQVELKEYFSGLRRVFSVPLDLRGTPFQKKCWNAVMQTAYGTTISYSDEAKNTGQERRVRAVASANARNPVVIIVPCHRVIGKTGKLAGYAGGVERKKWLIAHEQANDSLCDLKHT